MAVAEQIRVWLTMGLCGAALGAAYDILGALRLVFHGGMPLQAVLDLLFGVISAVCMICAGLYLRTDPFRLFAFLGVSAGFALYMTTLGTIVRVLHHKIHSFVKKS